jgi:hypothetical protein
VLRPRENWLERLVGFAAVASRALQSLASLLLLLDGWILVMERYLAGWT